MKTFEMLVASTVLSMLPVAARPQDQNSLAAIKAALTAKYPLTTTLADKTDIVTAGCVLILKKSNLLTNPTTDPISVPNTYKNGKISQSWIYVMQKDRGRTFVSGEKLWVTGIDISEKEVSFNLFTDPFSDVRYQAVLKFPFAKGTTPTTADVLATVAQVFDVQGVDNAQTEQAPAGRQAGAVPSAETQKPPEPPPAPITPPAPPAPDPKTISIGQTPEQVVAALGQPDKKANLGTKQVYYYKDMKVIFVGGKVKDVQ